MHLWYHYPNCLRYLITLWHGEGKRLYGDIETSPTERGTPDNVREDVKGESLAVTGATAEGLTTTTEVTRNGLTKLTADVQGDETVGDNTTYFTLAKEEGSGYREEDFGLLSHGIAHSLALQAQNMI